MAVKNKKTCDHFYFVTKSLTVGGRTEVTEVRCSKCLELIELDKLQWLKNNEQS